MSRRLLALNVLIVMVVTALTGGVAGAQQRAAQEGEPLAPNVIDVWPLPGVELAGDEPLTITFDQPMDAASVEAALTFTPALTGVFTWPDARTLAFTPDLGWPLGLTYAVTVETGATSTAGVALPAPYTFEARTIGALAVGTVSPEDGASDIAADARIVVSFNRPVVPLSATAEAADLPSPIVVQPPVEGAGEWVNTSLFVFTPASPLRGGTTYIVTVPDGLTSVDGAALEAPFTWRFSTLPPQIVAVRPAAGATGVLLGEAVTVTFSQPMDTVSTEAAFSLLFGGDAVAGALSWDEANTELTFTPTNGLELDSTYVINLAPTALGEGGFAALAEGWSSSFTTVPLPGVASTNPANGATDVSPWWGGVSISFRSPMNPDTLKDRITISPTPDSWFPNVYEDGTGMYLEFALSPNSTYIVTLLAGMEDIYGNATLTDYILTFTTERMPDSATPLNVGRLAVTGAYRDDTRIPMVVVGRPTVDFTLHRLDFANLEDAALGPYWGDTTPWWASRETVLREWTQNFEAGDEGRALIDVLLASDDGGQLPTGLYWLMSRSRDTNGGGEFSQFALIVANANLAIKRTSEEMLVWVTDMPTAAPLAGIDVTVYYQGRPVARGATDGDGIFRAPLSTPGDDAFISVVTEAEGVYGLWVSEYQPRPQDTANYLYTDRPIYRPGDTVYFRGVVRDKRDMDLTVPNLRLVRVTARSWSSDAFLFEGDVAVSAFGTFSGQFVLPEDTPVSDAYLRAEQPDSPGRYGAGVSFTVAEYRVPEFEVGVTAQQEAIFRGDTLNALIEASYYFGGAVGNAPVSWSAYGEPAEFVYTGRGRYTFGDDTWRYMWWEVDRGEGVTDGDGRFFVTSDQTSPDTARPMRVTVEATVTDESQQAITGRARLFWHPADVYVGLRTVGFFGEAGAPLTIDLIAVDTASTPLPGQRIDLAIEEVRWNRVSIEGQYGRWNWEERVIPVETAQVAAGAEGTASYTFTPPNGGIFRVRATAMDARERTSTSALRFWVMGTDDIWWGRPLYGDYIELVADSDRYAPGDVAQILVPIPFSGRSTVLVTTERVGVMSAEVVEAEGTTLVYEVPITADSAPTLHVTATVIKGIDDETPAPEFRQGSVSLNVEPVDRRLNVTVTPSSSRAQPREDVAFEVQVTDWQGEPVEAEVGLALVDKAVLALRPPNSISLEEAFYSYQGNYVTTTVSVYALLDRFETVMANGRGGGGGGGGAFEEVLIREQFETTPLWEPHVVTGADGRASVSVTLPDNLTTWQLDARSVTRDTDVGQTTTEIVSTLPLIVRPVAPRFFVAGDRVQLAAVINNNTDAAQAVEARLEASGVALVDEAAQEVTVPSGGRARVTWEVVTQDVAYVDLTFFAVSEAYRDAAKPALATGPDGTIPVYRYTVPDTMGTGGVLREAGARTEGVSLPPRLGEAEGALVVRLEPSLAAAAVGAFDYLREYPHECIEQTVSRFLPNAVTYRALRELGVHDPALEASLFAAIEEALAKLAAAQNADGGWGWFSGMRSDALVTAYAVLGLAEARDAGFAVDEAMLSRALNLVRADLTRPTVNTPAWRLNRQAFYFYVMAREGIGFANDYAALMEQRLRMSNAGRAYLLMAFAQQFPGNMAINVLASDLVNAARLSATGVHWEEQAADWWNWGSDTRTTALALSALIRAAPESDLLPNAVRWLMAARQGDHWQTTQETAWAVIAFTDWLLLTGELEGSYTYSLSLNRETLAEGDVSPETTREGQALRVAVGELLRDAVNRVTVARGEGEGALYYTAHLDLRLPAADVSALSRGISVQREYFIADEWGAVEDDAARVTGAQLGDTITVRLTITLPHDVYYFVLEDPLPAGTEAVDTGLLTTSERVGGPSIRPAFDESPKWYWGWWLFDRTEMRDQQVNLYADYLPRGTYVYTYQVRAAFAGEFQTLPAHAYAFYFPEVFGRSAGVLFNIAPAPAE